MKQTMPGVWKTKRMANEALKQQPFTIECRARHIVVPVYERNVLGEKVSEKPIGYCFRLRSSGEQR